MKKCMLPREALALRVIVNKVHISSITACAPKTCSLLLIIVLGLIQALAPSDANAQKVRLVFDTSWIDPGSINQSGGFQPPSGIGGLSGTATRETAYGRATYKWTLPRTIDSDGAPAKLEVQVTAAKDVQDTAYILIKGYDLVMEKDGKKMDVGVFAASLETKADTVSPTLIPARGYSEGTYYLEMRVELGRNPFLSMVFRYNIEQTASRGGGLEYDTDRPGQDYRNFDLPEARPELCQAQCGSDPNCKAFTYVKPGVQGPSARCWLKSGVPAAGASSCCISAVKPPS